MDCCRAVKGVSDAAWDRLGADKKHVWAHMLDSVEKCNPFHILVAWERLIRGRVSAGYRPGIVLGLGGSLGQL